MTRVTAEMINALMLKICSELDASLSEVRDRETDEVFKKYSSTVATVWATTLYEVMNPIYAHYPDLEPAELRRPGYSPDKSRAFEATHRIRPAGAEPIDVMVYDPAGGYAHTKEQWAAFQAGDCIQKPFWILIGGRWWQNNDPLDDTFEVEQLQLTTRH